MEKENLKDATIDEMVNAIQAGEELSIGYLKDCVLRQATIIKTQNAELKSAQKRIEQLEDIKTYYSQMYTKELAKSESLKAVATIINTILA